jgi:hypothetical protein
MRSRMTLFTLGAIVAVTPLLAQSPPAAPQAPQGAPQGPPGRPGGAGGPGREPGGALRTWPKQ